MILFFFSEPRSVDPKKTLLVRLFLKDRNKFLNMWTGSRVVSLFLFPAYSAGRVSESEVSFSRVECALRYIPGNRLAGVAPPPAPHIFLFLFFKIFWSDQTVRRISFKSKLEGCAAVLLRCSSGKLVQCKRPRKAERWIYFQGTLCSTARNLPIKIKIKTNTRIKIKIRLSDVCVSEREEP